ncbi:MAG: MBL fold metallo-hydrolase [Clostridiales bacterium]|nr:MBL fold metallo-hydrolase [Clostridiales bacterium]
MRTGRLLTAALLMLLILSLCACAAAEIYLSEPPADWADKDLFKLTVFDVNEGDAMLLECGGEAMMMDGGPNPFREDLKNALESRGYTHFKYFFSTHYHDDHINGLYHLMTYGFTADEFLHSYNPITVNLDELHGRAIRQADRNGIPNRKIDEGDVLTLGSATLNIHRYGEINNANGRSLTVKLTFGQSSVLFCADIIGRTQEYFTATLPAEELKADVLKVPHHGITPVNEDFLTVVDPAFSIVTNREKDVPKTKNQMEHRGIPTLYSGGGTVYCVTDGMDWYMWQTEGVF